MNSDFAEMIVDYIKNMRIGDSNSIGAIVKNVFNKELSVDELFDIQDIVMQKCEEQGIICDYSKNDGYVVGLPFNLDFIRKEKLNFNKELDYYKSSIEGHFEKIEKVSNNRQIELNKIKSMFFENNEEYFNSISPYLIETFDSDILINPTDTCVRFELCDIAKNKKMFFAINKNMFLLNDCHKHKLSLRGNSSEEKIIYLMKELKNVTSSWHLNYTDAGEYYWGLTICSDNNCSLYVGKSISVDNWNEFITLINETVKDLLNNAIKDIFI